ncbi:outer membrane beta-barrel protein [bacterium]|nr:outer membrane beta-barrel protein [bacterium]
MINRTTALLTVFLTVFLSTEALCWDGVRKGFVMGAGAGSGFVSYSQWLEGEKLSSDEKLPITSDFKIGYAPNNNLMLYWMSKVSWFSLDNVFGDTVTITNGIGAVGGSYYFAETAPSPYIMGGIGYSTWATPFEEDTDTWMGFGICAGAGYEFSRHISAEFSFSYGRPSTTEHGWEYETRSLSIGLVLNIMGY